MAYCAISNISVAEWNEIRKLCSQLKEYIDSQLDSLNTDVINNIRQDISVLNNKLLSIEIDQETQNRRLDKIEATCANTEITTEEVIEMYQGV